MNNAEYKEHLKKKCIDCGHHPCEGCGTWCDSICMDSSQLKYHNIDKFLEDLTPDELKEWEEDKHDEDWYPILCCEGECKYE